MKNLLLILTLISFSAISQEKGMVLIEGKKEHYINAKDSLSQAAIKEFKTAMQDAGVHYQPRIRRIEAIKSIKEDNDFVADTKNGVIRINSRLDYFPYTKRVAILQQLGINQGLDLRRGTGANILMKFDVRPEYEEKFRKQKKYNSTIYTLKKHLSK